MNPPITTLDGILADVYTRYIALDEQDFQKYYNVTMSVVQDLIKKMKEADPYFNKYCSTAQFAGSHYDRLRINKPDEFDMVIIISLPVNLRADVYNPAKSDILIENQSPGFVQLKMGEQFRNLPNRDDWHINITAYNWQDHSNYLLRSKFTDWFKGVVSKALNRYKTDARGVVYLVDGVYYTLRLSSSGPAITLIIENQNGFKLDVDLVPALKFPEERWPICRGYREIPPQCKKEIWMVVPKPTKAGVNRFDSDRSWRLAMHLQERELTYDSNNLRQAIRLVKKLRDSLEMHKVASYYVKTLFFFEVAACADVASWSRNSPATLFKHMVKRLHQVLVEGNLPYFWNKDYNLLEFIDRATLIGYANKLKKLIEVLDDPAQYKMVAKFLLSPSEFQEYNNKVLRI